MWLLTTLALNRSTSMIIYLYIKQHSITGLKYFGKTVSKNPFKYNGSGKYWVRHITKHDKKYVKTIEIWGFDNQDLCTEFALKFSKENNIVESEQWANLKIEDGFQGGSDKGSMSEEGKTNISLANSGRKNPHLSNLNKSREGKKPNRRSYVGQGNPNYGKPSASKNKSWYHNPISLEERYFDHNNIAPGFILGRLPGQKRNRQH